jgi:hypothetical protein
MAVYQPSYIDKSGKRVKAKVWWVNFTIAGKRVQESSNSKTQDRGRRVREAAPAGS